MDEPDAADGAVTALSISSGSLNDHGGTIDYVTAVSISSLYDHDETADVFDLYSAACSTARSIPASSSPVSDGPYFSLSSRSGSNLSLHTVQLMTPLQRSDSRSLHTPLLMSPVQRSGSNLSLHTVQLMTPPQRSDSNFGTAIADSDAEPRTANSVQRGPVSVITLSSSDDSVSDNAARYHVPPRSPSVISSFDCSTASSIGSGVSLSEVDWYAGQYTWGSGSDVSPGNAARTIPPSPASSVDSGEWPAAPGARGASARSKDRSPSTPPRRPTRAAAATARARIAQLLDYQAPVPLPYPNY